jgi:hypothetical protein
MVTEAVGQCRVDLVEMMGQLSNHETYSRIDQLYALIREERPDGAM